MFDRSEVLNENIEDGIPVGNSFARTPCLNQETADFINFALSQDNVDLSVIALEKLEKQMAFLSSIQARMANHVDSLQHSETKKQAALVERGVAHRIALARHRSQHASLAYLRRMRHLCADMPYLFSRFEAGDLNESMIMAVMAPFDETSSTERELFDEYYRKHPEMFEGASTTQVRDIAQRAVDEMLDIQRDEELAKAAKDRRVTIRPGKNCMHLNACLPIEVGIAVDKALESEAQRIKQAGDSRTIAQLKVDILVARVTGHSPEKPLPIKLHVNLVMTDMALFLDGKEPASFPGFGSVPAKYATRLIEMYDETDENTPESEFDDIRRRLKIIPALRRLYTVPGGQDLVAMDSKERLFKGLLRKFIEIRDPYCRTPHCGNKPRHADHVKQSSRGGETSSCNGCMKCEPCNLAKETAGWSEEVVQESPHQIVINPGGSIEYTSHPPPLVGLARLEKLLDSRKKIPEKELKNRPERIIHTFPEAS